jgi:hypothetical protein
MKNAESRAAPLLAILWSLASIISIGICMLAKATTTPFMKTKAPPSSLDEATHFTASPLKRYRKEVGPGFVTWISSQITKMTDKVYQTMSTTAHAITGTLQRAKILFMKLLTTLQLQSKISCTEASMLLAYANSEPLGQGAGTDVTGHTKTQHAYHDLNFIKAIYSATNTAVWNNANRIRAASQLVHSQFSTKEVGLAAA